MQILGLLLIGIVIGVLARLLLPGRQKIGLALTLLLGVGGALIGGVVASYLGTGNIWELNVVGFIVAVLASVGLLAVGQAAGIGRPSGRGAPEPERAVGGGAADTGGLGNSQQADRGEHGDDEPDDVELPDVARPQIARDDAADQGAADA